MTTIVMTTMTTIHLLYISVCRLIFCLFIPELIQLFKFIFYYILFKFILYFLFQIYLRLKVVWNKENIKQYITRDIMGGSEFSSFETALRKMKSYFELLTRNSSFELLTRLRS